MEKKIIINKPIYKYKPITYYSNESEKSSESEEDEEGFSYVMDEEKLQENNDEIAKSKNENKKIIQKLEEEIKENIGYTKESEKIYLSYIKYTNRIQDEYIEMKKKNLNEIQNMEIDLGQNIKSSLMKYYSYQKTYLNNILNDTEQKEKDIDKINIINDINIFINNNSTNDLPPYPIEYIPYIEKNEQITNEKNKLIKNLNKNIPGVKKIIIKPKENKMIQKLRTKIQLMGSSNWI